MKTHTHKARTETPLTHRRPPHFTKAGLYETCGTLTKTTAEKKPEALWLEYHPKQRNQDCAQICFRDLIPIGKKIPKLDFKMFKGKMLFLSREGHFLF